MDPAILRYAGADRLFYDEPRWTPASRAKSFALGEGGWKGWERRDDGPWVHWHPVGHRLPDQGWKIHVTATPDDAHETLGLVSSFCREHGLAFKHLAGPADVAATNGKDADRTAAGKFITIYPEGEARLHMALVGLDTVVGGRPGPYILSDLRWNEGPVFVRYGAFARRWTRDRRGQRVLALRHPSGDLVEDVRTAGFTPPAWVRLPGFLREQVDALGDSRPPEEFGYEITRVLHYSNAGGVYEATDREGTRVVLKEGRPFAGLTPDGRDAATRVADEATRLHLLAGPGVVGARRSFVVHGHQFLVLDHVEGMTLNSAVVRRSPAVRADSTPADRLEYRQWALGIAERVEHVVRRIHAAGYVHGDLHPANVIVTPADEITMLDLEVSCPAAECASVLIGAPGFVAPDRRGGHAADRYALACLKLFLFCPLTQLVELDPRKVDDLLEHIRTAYALDTAWIETIRADLDLPSKRSARGTSRLADTVDDAIRAWDVRSAGAIHDVSTLIARSLDAAADYSRGDRLWPGDPQQFAEQGYGLAHGAAGVLHALDAAGLDPDAQAFAWLGDATDDGRTRVDDANVGLFDGLAGVGWLHRLHGRDEMADAVLARVGSADLDGLGPDLYGGLPGVGLYLLSESDGAPRLVDEAADIAPRLRRHHTERDPLDPSDPAPAVRTGHGGLMWGAAGTALFALRLYERTGDPDHLGLATEALDYDLGHCTIADDGSLQVNEGWRLMPYLATGTAGIGLVAAQLAPHVADPERYLVALDGITAAACVPFTIEPGLFYGRAGMIHFLVALARLGLATPATNAALAAHVDGLKLHALRHRTGIGFPGRGLLRMSCDLATGSAGVLTALRAYSSLTFDPLRPGWDNLLPLLMPGPHATAPSSPLTHAIEGR